MAVRFAIDGSRYPMAKNEYRMLEFDEKKRLTSFINSRISMHIRNALTALVPLLPFSMHV